MCCLVMHNAFLISLGKKVSKRMSKTTGQLSCVVPRCVTGHVVSL